MTWNWESYPRAMFLSVSFFLSFFSSDSSLAYFINTWKNTEDRPKEAEKCCRLSDWGCETNFYSCHEKRETSLAAFGEKKNSGTSIFCVGALEACLIPTTLLALSSTSPVLPHVNCFLFVTKSCVAHWCEYLLLKNITLPFNRQVQKDLEKLAVKKIPYFPWLENCCNPTQILPIVRKEHLIAVWRIDTTQESYKNDLQKLACLKLTIRADGVCVSRVPLLPCVSVIHRVNSLQAVIVGVWVIVHWYHSKMGHVFSRPAALSRPVLCFGKDNAGLSAVSTSTKCIPLLFAHFLPVHAITIIPSLSSTGPSPVCKDIQ